jgi:3-hydroxybutyryl-CoA dehydrogenase
VSDPPGAPGSIGVVGAGTMGAGIAQLAAQAGARTQLFDPVDGAVERGLASARAGVEKLAAKGRLDEDVDTVSRRLAAAGSLAELAGCELIIEAAPESLALKQELFAALSAAAPQAVLASNTSSIPITAIAPAAADPSRVVGMHFFNPAPLMGLVEVIAGLESSAEALAVVRAAGEAMGKRVIDATDGPGFLVNRCNRPFGLEALRLVTEQIADVETIDRIVRLGGGFRMGPFELQDLVGIDVGLEVSKSFFELSFGEPRWRPSPLSAQMVAGGRHGRKTGRGWYAYDPGGTVPHRPADPDPPLLGGGDGRIVVVAGLSAVAEQIRSAARFAGWDAREPAAAHDVAAPYLTVDCGHDPEEPPAGSPTGAPRAILCGDGSLAALDPEGGAAGFFALPPLDLSRLVELTRTDFTTDVAAERAEHFFTTLGKHVEWVGDAPGLVLGRIVCQVINECAFAVGEGVGSPQDIDDGMVLGLNHPRGPLRWADAIGLDTVVGVLDALVDELREERYRAAPLLRRVVAFHPSHE